MKDFGLVSNITAQLSRLQTLRMKNDLQPDYANCEHIKSASLPSVSTTPMPPAQAGLNYHYLFLNVLPLNRLRQVEHALWFSLLTSDVGGKNVPFDHTEYTLTLSEQFD